MNRAMPTVLVVLAMVAACGDKEPENVPVQQQAADTTPLAAAPATKAAAPAPRPTPPPDPNAAANAELARATQVRTVQVASFPKASMAQWWVTKLQAEGAPAYATTAVVDGQEVTRLRIGAALTGAEARAIAARITDQYKWPTWITMMEDRSAVTGAMLNASRSYAAGR